ncbi:hypothetical protein, partial [Thiolapillus sp.]
MPDHSPGVSKDKSKPNAKTQQTKPKQQQTSTELSLTFILLESRIPYANDSASSKGFHVHKSPSRGRSCSVFEIIISHHNLSLPALHPQLQSTF